MAIENIHLCNVSCLTQGEAAFHAGAGGQSLPAAAAAGPGGLSPNPLTSEQLPGALFLVPPRSQPPALPL